jgi:dienelactone hydrolase
MKVKALFLAAVCVFACSPVAGAQNRVPAPLAPAGETGRRIADAGLLGNYFPASQRGPGVLLLGGSIGGLSPEMNRAAIALQAEGFSALHLSYFRAPGQNARLELIPLEYFGRALEWLRRQPEVDPDRLAIVGGSKGAEAALVVASRHDELKAVVAALPSSVVWPGIGEDGTSAGIDSSWSESGKALPALPHRPHDTSTGGRMAANSAASLVSSAAHPEAFIPVEKISGAVFLVCAESDQIWPSCPMARQIEQRLRTHGRPAPILLAYDGASHAAFGLPLPEGDARLGGAATAQKTNAARADSWPKAVAFLKASFTKR